MDRLFSLFSLYDFLGYVLAGALLLAGSYWAFAGLPHEPATATVLGLIALAYATGHLVQSAATIWEGWHWGRRGQPSTTRMAPPEDGASGEAKQQHAYAPALRELIATRVRDITGRADLSVSDMFAVARADLRARQLDGRAELMNTMYGLCRGLATSTALLVPIVVVAGFVTGDWGRIGIGIGVLLGACPLYLHRASRYSYRFADQVWRDFAALRPQQT